MSRHAMAYRRILNELRRASPTHSVFKNRTLVASFRTIFDRERSSKGAATFQYDIENIISFMRSQREYKNLLAKYNPLIDLTAEERIRATARRVGLDMPVSPDRSDD